jgi:hypothetical protein
MKKNHDLADITAVLKRETEKAFLLKSIDTGKEGWVPKSQVENNGDGTFTMPQWLAEDKELV